jgi:hypothetical protein
MSHATQKNYNQTAFSIHMFNVRGNLAGFSACATESKPPSLLLVKKMRNVGQTAIDASFQSQNENHRIFENDNNKVNRRQVKPTKQTQTKRLKIHSLTLR